MVRGDAINVKDAPWLEAGIPIDAVQRAGRWSNPNSMKPCIEKTTRTLQGTTNAITAGLRLAQDDAINHPNPTEER
uniref:Tyr recombinase domain-containing protein n=1 Tax=Panagrellus redivivus TaxID=6233 RepID=A0A7E4UYD3_PANRE